MCCMTGPAHAKNINKAQQNILHKEDQCEADPTYQGSSGITCKDNNRAALEHVKRATYLGGHVWDQSLLATPALPLQQVGVG